MKSTWAALATLAVCGVLLFARLGAVPVTSPHEARVVAPARTMIRSGDYLMPRFNGSPRLRKPPLAYWAVSLSGVVAASFEPWAARLPAAGCGLFTAAVVLALVGRYWGTGYGCVAAVSVVTTFTFLLSARLAVVDIFLTAFATAALAGWFTLYAGPAGRGRGALLIAAWAALALGVLAKGPAILPSVLVPLVVWPLVAPSRVALGRYHAVGLLVFLALALPWPMAVAFREAEATQVWFHEVATRSDPDVHRLRPFYYYLTRLPVILFPWTWPALGGVFVLVFPGRRDAEGGRPAAAGRRRDALRRAVADQPLTAYALLWLVGGLLGWSLIGQKKAEYLLPLIPAAAILATATWRYWMGYSRRLLCRLGIAGQAIVHLITIGVAVYFVICRPAWWPWCVVIGTVQVPAVVLLLRAAARGGMAGATAASLAAFLVTALVIVAVLMPLGGREFHAQTLARRTRALLHEDDRVLFFRMFSAPFIYAVDAPHTIETANTWSEVLRTAYWVEPREFRDPPGGSRAAPSGEPLRGVLRTAGPGTGEPEPGTRNPEPAFTTYVVVEEAEWRAAPAEVRAAFREVGRQENFGAKGIEGVRLDRKGECVLLLASRRRPAATSRAK